MDESTFWICLEYRVCGELAGFAERDLRRLWCDGFIPEQYIFDDPSPRVLGRAWIGIGNWHQEEWKFTLLLDRFIRSCASVAWSDLLPPPDVTRWLTVDPIGKQLVVEPAVAVPDAW